MHIRRLVVALIAAAVVCAAAIPGSAQERLKVLATFSILADLVANVGGDRVGVTTLVGSNSDAHVYSPAPADAKKLVAAAVVVTNGLGFEGWLGRLIKASGTKASVVVASKGIKPRRQTSPGHGHAHDTDPHAWQSVANVKIYVANIRAALIDADPAGKAVYEANAAGYLAKLDALDRELREAIAAIPKERRRIITSHEAFSYFEAAYGIDFIAPQGVSTDSEPSARDVARIITQIKRQKIPAVFLDNITDPRLIQRIAAESGARIGGRLYSDALTDEHGPAPSYIELIRHNVRQLQSALAS
ncbi:MAG: metal ABC transporter substrate-binding protein [Hyphomicrobiales bacterium]|nr:metal ABC transporter substrate-binding protein [Hyphomicrobiales bacterium]